MPLSGIKLYRFTFTFRAKDPIKFTGFPGSVVRGGFGYALKKSVCLADPSVESCAPCAFAPSCAYAAVFESPNVGSQEIMKKATHWPHPFAMAPMFGQTSLFKSGELFEIEIALFGRGVTYLPHFVHAFERLGRMGLGVGRGKYALVSVRNAHNGVTVFDEHAGLNCSLASPVPPPAAAPPPRIAVDFVTPCRVMHDGDELRVAALPVVIRNIVRRCEALCYFYGDSAFAFDRDALVRAADAAVTVHETLRWESAARYSKRKRMKMTLGGFVGTARYSGDMSSLYPVLKTGEIVQIGKSTSFGYGVVRVREDCETAERSGALRAV